MSDDCPICKGHDYGECPRCGVHFMPRSKSGYCLTCADALDGERP